MLLINLRNQMNIAIPNYMMLIMKSQMTLNRLSIPLVMTVDHFFNLNSKSFLWEQRICLNQYMSIFFFLLWSFSVTLDCETEYQGSCWFNFLPVNCSFSESTISLQYHYKVSFVDRHWNKWKNGEHHMVIIQGIWKSKLFLVIPPPTQSHNIVIQFFVET